MSSYLAPLDTNDVEIPQLHMADGAERACMVAILDGSDEFARVHGDEHATRKESIHFKCCESEIASHDGIVSPGSDRFRDAVLANFSGEFALHRALAAGLAIHQDLNLWNVEHQLNWMEQIHTRVGISMSSFSDTVFLARQAQRGEIVVDAKDWQRFTEGESLLVSPRLGVRFGASDEVWYEILKEGDEGVEPLDSHSPQAQGWMKFFEQQTAELQREQNHAMANTPGRLSHG